MGIEKVNECPNCKGTSFGSLGGAGMDSTAVLIGGEKIPNGKYEANTNKTIPVTPIICDSCGYVMLFNWTVK